MSERDGRFAKSSGYRARHLGHVSRLALLVAAASVAGSVHAQESASLEEILVTGSRIVRSNVTSPTPVEIISDKQLGQSGLENLASVLYELPQFGRSDHSSTAGTFDSFNSGVNTVNLRNLGAGRTLVLIDGRRAVSGIAGTSAVDFNTIPIDFIERVEVVTDGASAVYGSDAIAGVVNIIQKSDFEGVSLTGRGSLTEAGGGTKYNVAATIGGNFGSENRGNAVLSIGYYKDKGLMASKRKFAAEDQFLGDVGPEAYSTFSEQGRFLTNLPSFADHFTFDDGGNLIQGYDRTIHGFNRAAFRTISSPNDRLLTAAKANYDIFDSVTLFGDVSFAHVDTIIIEEPRAFMSANVADGPAGGIPLDNPFIPQGLLDFINDRNANADPLDDILSIEYARRLGEVGVRTFDNSRQTLRTAVGLKGDVFNNWTWDAYYSFGQTLQSQTGEGQINTTNIILALDVEADPDVPGKLRCVSEMARDQGCVPLNLFGAGSVTPEAAAFIEAPGSYRATIRQNVMAANAQGPLFDLPAGAVSVAAGIEHRRESSKEVPDVLTQTGQTSGEKRPASSGRFDVTEGYMEVDVPVLASQPFVDYFGLNAAIRYADYSTVGGALSWKVGASWEPSKSVRFRGTYGTSVRAPNIGELFTTGAPSFGSSVVDPCNGVGGAGFVDNTGGVLTANCLAEAGVKQRVDLDGSFVQGDLNRQLISVTASGNPNLREEKADTLTVGVVFTPMAVPGLVVTADYYRIEIDKAIQNISSAKLMELCYTQPAGVRDQFCSVVERFPSNPGGNAEFNTGQIRRIQQNALNIGGVDTSGIDVSVRYGFDLDSTLGVPGTLDMNVNYTWLIELEQFTTLPDGVNVEVLDGLIGASRHRWNGSLTYGVGPFQAHYGMRYLGKAQDSFLRPADDPFNIAKAKIYQDLQLRYAFNDSLFMTVGVENLFDTKPPHIPSGTNSADTGCNRPCSVYDPFGRTFQFGVTKQF